MSARIIVIAGPTAAGKTECALALARRLDGELIGADSVQVYRGFDIGSSKPTRAELADVVHHLIDIREPTELLDAAGYAALADQAIADVAARGRVPIVVGGTGLWLRALLRGLVDAPPVNPVLRARLEREWDQDQGQLLHARLHEVDPISAARIHLNDRLRVVRALEVFEQTGQPLGAARQAHALGQPRYRCALYVLDLPIALHRERVAVRVRAMLDAGLVLEVEALIARYGSSLRPLGSVGYKQVLEHLTAGVTLAETEAAIVRATQIYARRQRTWWGSDPSVTRRVLPSELLEAEAMRELERFLQTAR